MASLETSANAVIVSDLHLGLPYFRVKAFTEFVRSLNPDIELILNGDIVDAPGKSLDKRHESVLELLVTQSYERKVVWIYGNHDQDIQLCDSGNIEFRKSLTLQDRLMIVHGDGFDTLMPRNRWFLRMFKMVYQLRLRMGAKPTHVAEVARKWAPILYHAMTRQVRRKAMEFASARNLEVISCGHTHYAEHSVCDGIEYFNTGTWTEQRLHYVAVCPDGISLCRFEPTVTVESEASVATPQSDRLGRAAI